MFHTAPPATRQCRLTESRRGSRLLPGPRIHSCGARSRRKMWPCLVSRGGASSTKLVCFALVYAFTLPLCPEQQSTNIDAHHLGLSMNLLALLALTHVCFPKSHIYTTKFFSQSYYNPRSGEYGIGKDDYYQIFFYMTIFTALRAGTMDYVLAPLARWWGITKRKTIDRFSEQGYLVLYYAIFWPMGMVSLARYPGCAVCFWRGSY